MSSPLPPPPPPSNMAPPPGYAAYSGTDFRGGGLRRVKGFAVAIAILLGVSILGQVVTLATRGAARDSAQDYLDGTIDEDAYNNDLLASSGGGLLAGVATLAILVLSILWLHRIVSNHQSLGRHLSWSPGWAIGGWFLPPCVYIIPFLILRESFRASDPDSPPGTETWRGGPENPSLAAEHRSRGRLGDADWFGASAAILAGDLTFVWADELFDATPLPAEAVARARAVFTTLRREVIAGQYLDLVLAADGAAYEETARHVALLKSARYTVTRPLLLGAALAPEVDGQRVAPALQAYGDAVGMAFQMRDDVLGLFGDPAETGKGCLDDLREGKRTLMVLRALRLADAAQRRTLQSCLGAPDLDEVGAAEARRVVADSGALASVEALIAALHDTGRAAVADLPDPARTALTELADLAIRRRA